MPRPKVVESPNPRGQRGRSPACGCMPLRRPAARRRRDQETLPAVTANFAGWSILNSLLTRRLVASSPSREAIANRDRVRESRRPPVLLSDQAHGQPSAPPAWTATGRKEPRVTAYYVHIDFRTPAGGVAWFDGVVEAPNLQAAARQAEERAGSVAKSIGKYSTACQPLLE
jgi:hypothetical protein